MNDGFPVTTDLRDVFDSDCPAREILDHITSRWGILVLVALKDGSLRFHQVRDRIEGISEKMLAQNLRVLARDGLLERTVRPTAPPEVSYALTPLGHQAVARLCEVVTWISQSAEAILAAQARYDTQAAEREGARG